MSNVPADGPSKNKPEITPILPPTRAQRRAKPKRDLSPVFSEKAANDLRRKQKEKAARRKRRKGV